MQLQTNPLYHFFAINSIYEIDAFELIIVLVELTIVDPLQYHAMFASGLPPFISHARIIVVLSFTEPVGVWVIDGVVGESKMKLKFQCRSSVNNSVNLVIQIPF